MKYISLIALSALMLMSTSCSVVNTLKKGNSTTVSGAQATKVESSEKASSSEDVVPPAGAVPQYNDYDYTTVGSGVESALEKDSLQAPPPVEPVHAAVQAITMTTPLARNLGGEWQIVQVGSKTIDLDEDMPYIVFEPKSAVFYAYNGCNTLNGVYAVTDKDQINFYNVISTLRYCGHIDFDSEINTVISEAVTSQLAMQEIGTETFVDFRNAAGKTLMRLRRGNLEFLNGQWDVESIAGLEKLDVPAELFFDLTSLKLHGNTGCNILNGQLYLDHRRSNAIDISNVATTRMACPYTEQQTALLVALEQTASAISDGADHVMLLDSDGRDLMTLRRAIVEQNNE